VRLGLLGSHRLLTQSLAAALATGGHQVELVTADLDLLVAFCAESPLDVCLVDVDQADGSIGEAAARIRAAAPGTRILLLSGECGPDAWQAYDAHAVDGMVNKVCGITTLELAIARVARGERVVEAWTRPVRNQSVPSAAPLSARERQVLSLIVAGLSTQAMAAQLGVSTNTVRSHVQNVLGKLGVSDRGKAARLAIESGLAGPEPAQAAPELSVVRSPDPDAAIDILLVDDHRVLAEVLALRLRLEPGVRRVEMASSVPAARAVLNTFQPDLILLDLHLENGSGLDLLKDGAPGSTVVVLSGASAPQLVIEALHAGAAGWVSKDTEVDVLLRATSFALRGELVVPRTLMQPVLRRLLRDSLPDHESRGFIDELTPREREVLDCLVAGMTRAEAAAWLHLSTNTVRTHVQHLLRRADVHSTAALVAKARALDTAQAG
jgi:DNA-binding NarL/FixJ family response regulator